jgi:hypothetical protein
MTGRQGRRLAIIGHTGERQSQTLSPGGQHVRVRNGDKGSGLFLLRGHHQQIRSDTPGFSGGDGHPHAG